MVVFVVQQYELAVGVHVSPPSWTSLPSPSLPYPLDFSKAVLILVHRWSLIIHSSALILCQYRGHQSGRLGGLEIIHEAHKSLKWFYFDRQRMSYYRYCFFFWCHVGVDTPFLTGQIVNVLGFAQLSIPTPQLYCCNTETARHNGWDWLCFRNTSFAKQVAGPWGHSVLSLATC